MRRRRRRRRTTTTTTKTTAIATATTTTTNLKHIIICKLGCATRLKSAPRDALVSVCTHHERRVAGHKGDGDGHQGHDHECLMHHARLPVLADRHVAGIPGYATHDQERADDGEVADGNEGDDEQTDTGEENAEDPVHDKVAVEVDVAPGARTVNHVTPDLKEELNPSVDR